jgi:hypothetical protein
MTVREMDLDDLLAELEDALATLAQCRAIKGDSVLTPLEYSVIRAVLTRAADFIGEQDEREKRSR